MKIISVLLIAVCLFSCKSKPKQQADAPPAASTSNKQVEAKAAGQEPAHRDTMEFMAYIDGGDYSWLTAKKENEILKFVNDANEDRSLLRGDVVDIVWLQDTISIAGDDERAEPADWITTVKKIKNGKAAQFRKDYGKQLTYYSSEENNYTREYLNEIYQVVEYYLANSGNELIRQMVKHKEEIQYSIEQKKTEDKEYTVLGIGGKSDYHVTVAQWLYYDSENKKIFEYDLPADNLVEFR